MVARVVLALLAVGVLALALRYSIWFIFLIPALAVIAIAFVRRG